jgi:Uma2 family endonuclease
MSLADASNHDPQLEPDDEPRPRAWTVAERRRLYSAGLSSSPTGLLLESGAALRFDREGYECLIDLQLLRHEDRTELIAGEVLEVSPQKSPHATAVLLAAGELTAKLPAGYHVRQQLPLALSPDSEPEPDVAVVGGAVRDFARGHPSRAVLVVEVSDRTLTFDRSTKAGLYAEAGIDEYWIVDLRNRRLEVRRDPTAGAPVHGGACYRTVLVYRPGETVSPSSFPEIAIAITDLLP